MTVAQSDAPVVLQDAGAGTDGDQYPQATASTDVALLDSLPKEQQELAVSMMLDQSKQWLDRAMQSTNPAREVSEFKAFVATVAEASKQKKLSEGIQLDATEMVRRAERALGVAIRKGQEHGEILKPGQRPTDAARVTYTGLSRPTDFARLDELRNTNGGIYDMTDGVSDDDFAEAIAEAKQEGNLSRSNVTRKLKNLPTHSEQQATKWQQIRDLANDRLTSAQIAKRVGMTEDGLRAGARREGIEFPADEYVRRTRRINGLEVMERTISGLEVNQSSLELVDFDDITPEQAAEWLQRLAEPLRAINRMKTRLKEISNG